MFFSLLARFEYLLGQREVVFKFQEYRLIDALLVFIPQLQFDRFIQFFFLFSYDRSYDSKIAYYFVSLEKKHSFFESLTYNTSDHKQPRYTKSAMPFFLKIFPNVLFSMIFGHDTYLLHQNVMFKNFSCFHYANNCCLNNI